MANQNSPHFTDKLMCCRCLHKSSSGDMVMLYGPPSREQALCVDTEKCDKRLEARKQTAGAK